MNRFTKVTDGAIIVDVAESVGGYNYYSYVRNNGEWIILREKTDGTEYRYKSGASDYSTAWINKATHNYTLPVKS